jgi:hypothetical protein
MIMLTKAEVVEGLAEFLCDAYHGRGGVWANPGALPDELDRDQWRHMAEVALSYCATNPEAAQHVYARGELLRENTTLSNDLTPAKMVKSE